MINPTETLEDIRTSVALFETREVDSTDDYGLAELIGILDHWMSKGGASPMQWIPVPLKRGRPRLPDGVKLDVCTHGPASRAGYNQGCRCGGCREANRNAAVDRRERINANAV